MPLTTTASNDIVLKPIGTIGELEGAEISAFDPASQRLFVTSGSGLQIIDLSDPTAPALIATLDLVALGGLSNDVSSVAVKNGIVAASLLNADKTQSGEVMFLNAADGSVLATKTVGNHPDMVVFTPDGTKLLVANEGELTEDNADSPGSISIIDISGGVPAATVTSADFSGFDGQEQALRDAGVRIFPGNSVSNDVEPEYIAISPDGTKAMITLQENNAVALLDIGSATITDIVPLGLKDFSPLLADFSDRDGDGGAQSVNLTTGHPVFGLYMPDAIASFQAGDATYYVIANEGDDRDDFLPIEETARVKDLDLDDTAFPNEGTLNDDNQLGRLTVTNVDGSGGLGGNLSGDTDGDGDVEQIIAYGGRSFSILDENGNIIFDSADIIEQVVAATPGSFTDGTALDDSRSDNKGPEPEGITIGTIGDRTYAFVALERGSGGAMVFDITDPEDVTFTSYARNDGDISPEGLAFIGGDDSPTGNDLLVVSNEVSNTVTVYAAVDFTLQLLHLADAEAGLLASTTAPLLAALVDGFDDQYENTLILAGGDNFIAGPFLAAGTDPSVIAVVGKGSNDAATDIQIHNLIGVEASTVGNHEFDLGPKSFADAVKDAAFPYLSANLDYSADTDAANTAPLFVDTVAQEGLETASSLAGKLVPSAVVEKGGEVIGLVGVTTQILEQIASTGAVEVEGFAGDGAETNDMALLAEQLQPVIDDLIAQGVNKIVLMAHLQQIAFEQELAPLLTGVDIILAAGSNTRLGDDNDVAVTFPGHAANFADTYPIVTAGADGKPTLIVNTDNEYTYLGRLVVDFDGDGDIILETLDDTINGAYASTTDNVAAAWGIDPSEVDAIAFADGTKGAAVKEITDAVDAVIDAKDGNIFGATEVYLEGERAIVRTQETNLGNLSADANAYALAQALGEDADHTYIVSLKNGGGIRSAIGAVDVVTGDKLPPLANEDVGKEEGGISQLDVENSLRFNNKLVSFETTPEGIKELLEHGVAASGPGKTPGQFPQIGGIAFSWDPSGEPRSSTDPVGQPGARVVNIALVLADGSKVPLYIDGELVEGAPETITVVTLNFLAAGGDSYPIPAIGSNFQVLLDDGSLAPLTSPSDPLPTNALGEQQALYDFLEAFHDPETGGTPFADADTPASGDTRNQNLDQVAEDTVLDAEILGGSGSQTLFGDVGDDLIYGFGGKDKLFGGDGDDSLFGGAGNDVLFGGDGEDLLLGGLGSDKLVGGDGDDILRGGAGRDRMFGGGGDDQGFGGSGRDVWIVDGNADEFRITTQGSKVIIVDLDTSNGDEGRDILVGIERIRFDDDVMPI